MAITKRGKRVRAVALTLLVGGLLYLLFDVTTPKECKNKSVSQMSQFCIDLLYPH